MKVVALNGSPKKDGNTNFALEVAAEELKREGINVEIIHMGNRPIRGCVACGQCAKRQDLKCALPDDGVNEIIAKMAQADGILFGSPVYFSGVAGTMKSFMDRAFYVSGVNGNVDSSSDSNSGGVLRNKIAASVVAVRRSGGLPTFNQLNNYITYAEMVMPTSKYWNVIHGTKPGDAQYDEEGVQIMRVLGKNMAYLLKVRAESKVEIPQYEQKSFTSFIR